MKKIVLVLFAATLLGGCAVYADPYGASVYGPAPSVYVSPPVVIAPRPYYYGGYRYSGWYGHRRHW